MNASRSFLLAFILLVASWMQAAVGSRIALFHSRPDLILSTLICISILVGASQAAIQSTWAGFLTSVLAGFNYGSIMVSRLITGTLCGWLNEHMLQESVIVPPVTAFFATWLSECLYFLMAPDLHHLRWWLHMVLGEALYNTVLSLPIYFGLKALGYGGEADSGYSPYIETI